MTRSSDTDCMAASLDESLRTPPVVVRRVFLLWLGGGALACTGEGGGEGGGARNDAPTASASTGTEPTSWNVPALQLFEGDTKPVRLAETLPRFAVPGGTFALHPTSTPLPVGMSLSPNGDLSLGTATAGTTEGVVFVYEEPA